MTGSGKCWYVKWEMLQGMLLGGTHTEQGTVSDGTHMEHGVVNADTLIGKWLQGTVDGTHMGQGVVSGGTHMEQGVVNKVLTTVASAWSLVPWRERRLNRTKTA